MAEKPPDVTSAALAAHQLGDTGAGRRHQLVHIDEELVGLGHRRDDLRIHSSAAEARHVFVRREVGSDAEETRVDIVAIPRLEGFGVRGPLGPHGDARGA